MTWRLSSVLVVFSHAAGEQDQPSVWIADARDLHARRRPRQRAGRPARSPAREIDRVLAAAARVARERLVPLPDRHRDTSGAMPGEMHGRAPAACRAREATSTRSPSPMPSCAAVSGLISTQLLHIADVSGSGISCSHGRCASDPSRNCGDGYGRKWNGYCCASPSNCGSATSAQLGVDRRRRRGRRPRRRRQRAPPAALLLRVGPRVAAFGQRRQRRERRRQHLLERLPRQLDRRRQLPADLEQHVRRRARLVQRLHHRRRDARRPASIEPDSGTASTHDSRNE